MSGEVLAKGPLDLVRALTKEAAGLDQLVSGREELSDEFVEQVLSDLNRLDESNPLMMSQVIAYGDVLTQSMNEDGPQGLMLPWSPDDAMQTSELCPPQDTYGGLCLIKVYDPEDLEEVYRVAHMIVHQDQYSTDLDIYGRLRQIRNTTLVCADGSELEPVEPINAHSLEDLHEDTVVKQFDAIINTNDLDEIEKLRTIGKIARRLFIGEEFELNKNKQRASYLNSSGLLVPKPVSTRDLMFGTKDILENDLSSDFKMFSDTSRRLQFYPKMLDWSYSYDRTSSTKACINKAGVDLYATGHLDTGAPVIAPLRSLSTKSN